MKLLFCIISLILTTFRYSAPHPPLIKMVRIQAGIFSVGKALPVKGETNEYPLHTVSTGTFEIGTLEVTQAQFEKVMGYNPSKTKELTSL